MSSELKHKDKKKSKDDDKKKSKDDDKKKSKDDDKKKKKKDKKEVDDSEPTDREESDDDEDAGPTPLDLIDFVKTHVKEPLVDLLYNGHSRTSKIRMSSKTIRPGNSISMPFKRLSRKRR